MLHASVPCPSIYFNGSPDGDGQLWVANSGMNCLVACDLECPGLQLVYRCKLGEVNHHAPQRSGCLRATVSFKHRHDDALLFKRAQRRIGRVACGILRKHSDGGFSANACINPSMSATSIPALALYKEAEMSNFSLKRTTAPSLPGAADG